MQTFGSDCITIFNNNLLKNSNSKPNSLLIKNFPTQMNYLQYISLIKQNHSYFLHN